MRATKSKRRKTKPENILKLIYLNDLFLFLSHFLFKFLSSSFVRLSTIKVKRDRKVFPPSCDSTYDTQRVERSIELYDHCKFIHKIFFVSSMKLNYYRKFLVRMRKIFLATECHKDSSEGIPTRTFSDMENHVVRDSCFNIHSRVKKKNENLLLTMQIWGFERNFSLNRFSMGNNFNLL